VPTLARQHAPVVLCCRPAAAWLHATARATYFQLALGRDRVVIRLLAAQSHDDAGAESLAILVMVKDRSPSRL